MTETVLTAEELRADTWQGWQVTEAQARAIMAGDRDARNAFYTDNYEHICRLAAFFRWKRSNKGYCFAETLDFVHTAYIALCYLDFFSGKPLSLQLMRWFINDYRGGRYVFFGEVRGAELVLDEPLCEDTDATLLDLLPAPAYRSEAAARADDERAERLLGCLEKIIPPHQMAIVRNWLFGVPMCECVALSKFKSKNISSIRYGLIKNYAKIMDVLREVGSLDYSKFVGLIPSGFEHVIKMRRAATLASARYTERHLERVRESKRNYMRRVAAHLTEEQRQARREYDRAYRARKRAEQRAALGQATDRPALSAVQGE